MEVIVGRTRGVDKSTVILLITWGLSPFYRQRKR